mgnify:CR=1 FL=1
MGGGRQWALDADEREKKKLILKKYYRVHEVNGLGEIKIQVVDERKYEDRARPRISSKGPVSRCQSSASIPN